MSVAVFERLQINPPYCNTGCCGDNRVCLHARSSLFRLLSVSFHEKIPQVFFDLEVPGP